MLLKIFHLKLSLYIKAYEWFVSLMLVLVVVVLWSSVVIIMCVTVHLKFVIISSLIVCLTHDFPRHERHFISNSFLTCN